MSESAREAEGAEFECDGGALCLDFVNTLGDRPRCREERLHDYADLLRWAGEAGALAPEPQEDLARRVALHPRKAAAVLERALALREAIYRTFSAVASGAEPIRSDVAAINRALGRALPRLRIEPDESAFTWSWSGAPGRLEAVLWPVVRSAAELLTSDDAPALRECASDTCSWMFLDRSRTRRRRWCSMQTCGNRAKARRHYARRRGTGS